MTLSVNTNASALTALQYLTGTNRELDVAQNRINTGLRVAGAKDNSGIYAVAQNLRGDLRGLSSAIDSIRRTSSVLDVAINATETVSDLLVDLKAAAVAAADAGLDAESRAAYLRDYNAISAQITDVVNSASFNGTNIISAAPANLSAIIDDSATRTITVAGVAVEGLLTFTRNLATTSTAAVVQAQLANIDASQTAVSATLATFGAKSKQLEAQLDFTQKLADTIEVGIGNLVDADVARESARLNALQVRQQLGLQALSIANQAPQALLALFR